MSDRLKLYLWKNAIDGAMYKECENPPQEPVNSPIQVPEKKRLESIRRKLFTDQYSKNGENKLNLAFFTEVDLANKMITFQHFDFIPLDTMDPDEKSYSKIKC